MPPGESGRLMPHLLQRSVGSLALAAAALALEGLSLRLCLLCAPARFYTHLFVFVRQFPGVGVLLVPVLALAILRPVP